jgi:hypothetical protein
MSERGHVLMSEGVYVAVSEKDGGHVLVSGVYWTKGQ